MYPTKIVVDAVPKKRGPKTDVLEALLKRVDGLEKRLQDENKNPISPTSPVEPDKEPPDPSASMHVLARASISSASTTNGPPSEPFPRPFSFPSQPSPPVHHFALPDSMLDAYFARIHGKPYFILDESVTRQSHQMGQLPAALSMAIYAITLRFVFFVPASSSVLTIADIRARPTPPSSPCEWPWIMLCRPDAWWMWINRPWMGCRPCFYSRRHTLPMVWAKRPI
jgi:hypothetical protein